MPGDKTMVRWSPSLFKAVWCQYTMEQGISDSAVAQAKAQNEVKHKRRAGEGERWKEGFPHLSIQANVLPEYQNTSTI